MALKLKQQRFVDEYLIDLNATQAAIRAGYSPRTAASQGERLLRNAEIRAAVTEGRRRQQERTEINADRVLKEYARLAFSDIGQVLDFDGVEPRLRPVNQIPADARRAIASVKVRRFWEGSGEDAREVEMTEFRLWEKLGALRALADHLGLDAPKKTEVNVRNDDDELTDEELDARIAERQARLARGPGGEVPPASPS